MLSSNLHLDCSCRIQRQACHESCPQGARHQVSAPALTSYVTSGKSCDLWEPSFLLFSSVQSLSRVWLFATPRTAACQASLSIIDSWSLLKLMSIESVMPSNHLILCRLLLLLPSVFPSSRVFFQSQLFASGSQSIRASTLASVLPLNIHRWFLLGPTALISLLSKELSRVFWNGDKSWRKISCLKHIRDKEEKWEWVWEGQGEDEKTKWVTSISTLKLLCWGRTWN